MPFTVAVSGATGYAGGELLRLLYAHPHLRVSTVTGHSTAGQRLGEVQPHLHALADMEIRDSTVENLSGHDVVFLALPHGESAPLARQLPENTIVVDAGADHRLTSPDAWEAFYGGAYAGHWPYGLPELLRTPSGIKQREDLGGVTRIAIPGCYPTGALLALAPAIASGVVHTEDIVIVSATGTSGAGKSLKPHLLSSEVMGSMSPYGVGGVHRHTPEIEQGLSGLSRDPVAVSFTPTLAPMTRGILTTATAKLADGATLETAQQAFHDAYAHEQFVHVLPQGQWPSTKSVIGSNRVLLQLAVDHRVGRLIVSLVLDNLTKGTAGGAVQSVNIALGLPESAGLDLQGLAP